MNTETLPTFNSRRIDVGGLSLNVVVEGEGPDVLLIHGFPDSHQVWRHQIPALVEAGYRVIAPDLRGYGDSDMPRAVADYRIESVVSDLVALLDELGVNKARVVAHDWGAIIGWWLAMLHPERVDRYVAMSVGHPNAYARGGLAQKLKGYYVYLMQLTGLIEWLLKAGNWFVFRLLAGNHAEFGQWRREMSRPGRLTAAINLYRANLGSMVLPRNHPRTAVPVLGIWSSRDWYLAEKQMKMSQRYVDAPFRYVRVDGVSHWLQLDAPERVNPLLLEYLA